MQDKELFFVIPTYRLRDVGETIELYDEHFWRNGHSVRMLVFDDSSPANQVKYYPLLEQTQTHNDIFYVGSRGRRSSSSPISTGGYAIKGWSRWSRICSGPAMAATAITPSCTPLEG